MTDSFKLDFNLIICVIVKKHYTAKHSIRGQGFIYFEQEYNSHFLIMFAGMFGFIIGFLICLVLNVLLFFFVFYLINYTVSNRNGVITQYNKANKCNWEIKEWMLGYYNKQGTGGR